MRFLLVKLRKAFLYGVYFTVCIVIFVQSAIHLWIPAPLNLVLAVLLVVPAVLLPNHLADKSRKQLSEIERILDPQERLQALENYQNKKRWYAHAGLCDNIRSYTCFATGNEAGALEYAQSSIRDFERRGERSSDYWGCRFFYVMLLLAYHQVEPATAEFARLRRKAPVLFLAEKRLIELQIAMEARDCAELRRLVEKIQPMKQPHWVALAMAVIALAEGNQPEAAAQLRQVADGPYIGSPFLRRRVEEYRAELQPGET